MLRQDALALAHTLAEKLTEAGFRLEPLPNTPLASLLHQTDRTPLLAISTTDVGNVREILTATVDATNYRPPGAMNGTAHDEVFDEAVRLGAMGVRNHILIIRTMVIPAIQDLYTSTQMAVQELTASEMLNYEVRKFDLPAPLRNTAFTDLLANHSKVGYHEKTMLSDRFKFAGSVALDQDLLKTGTPSIDKDIEKWLSSLDPNVVNFVWAKYFQSNSQLSMPRSNDGTYNLQQEKLTEMLIAFLIARTVADRDPLADSHLSLSDYQMRAKSLRQQAAGYLAQQLDRWSGLIKRKTLVMGTSDKTVHVIEPVYKKFIEDCADKKINPTDVLFGNLISKRNLQTATDLAEEAPALVRKWLKFVGDTGIAERTNRLTQTKSALRRCFIKQINEAIIAAGGDPNNSNVDKENILKRFMVELNTMTEKDLDDLQSVVERLICCARFPDVNALPFLNDLNLIMKDHPTLDIRECASMAALNYLAQWGMSMIKVVPQ